MADCLVIAHESPSPKRLSLPGTRRRSTAVWAAVVVLTVAALGCQSEQWVSVRKTPENPLSGPLDLFAASGPNPTPRTEQLLRRHDLADEMGQAG